MQTYTEFVKDSMGRYEKLPQEGSELYKRHFIHIPFDLKTFDSNTKLQDGALLKSSIEEWSSKLGIKFNATIGSDEHVMGDGNEFMKAESNEKLGATYMEGMHNSAEDKYVGYINASSANSVLIRVPDRRSASINLLFLNSDRPLNTKLLIRLGNGSDLSLMEYYGSLGKANSCLGSIHEIDIGDDSKLELSSLHNENSNTLNLSFCKNRIGNNSHLKFNSVYNGGAHTRVRNTIEADGKESSVEVNEVVFGCATQKFDINTNIVNIGAHTSASLETKAALMDNSFCIMKGFAKIKKGAVKARSYVHERGILLDKSAKVYGLPDMSVDENDVKATHSSATSPVDPESVFYLMSKGIDEIGVRKLLVSGFFAASLSKMQNAMIRGLSMSLINNKLENRTYGAMPKMDTRNVWVGPSDSQDSDMFKGHYKYRGAE